MEEQVASGGSGEVAEGKREYITGMCWLCVKRDQNDLCRNTDSIRIGIGKAWLGGSAYISIGAGTYFRTDILLYFVAVMVTGWPCIFFWVKWSET